MMSWFTDKDRRIAYDSESGEFFWLVSTGPQKAGNPCGTQSRKGYRSIHFQSKRVKAHRLAWFLVHGEWPALSVDHINGDRSDNRIQNLRLATVSQNNCNSKRGVRNTSGFKGASYHKAKNCWQAQIRHSGRVVHLGYYNAPEAAHQAYVEAAERFHGQFARPA